MSKNNEEKPTISFGLITDIQYADEDDALNYRKDKLRYYRNSLNLVKEAVQKWHESLEDHRFKFIIQLGDIIDGRAAPYREKALKSVLDQLESDFKFHIPDFNLYHIWGNHEFYNYNRSEILNTVLNSAKLFNASANVNYYVIQLTEKLKLICLDFYAFSAIGHEQTSEVYKEAVNMLGKYNNNKDLNKNEGLDGLEKRFNALNGTLGKDQMKWFEDELIHLIDSNNKAIVCGHIPIHLKATTTTGMAWNYEEMLDLFKKYSKCILAYICGHEHSGGYFYCEETNIHHLTVPAILEAPPGTNSFATVKIYKNRIDIEGVGLTGSYRIFY